MLAIVLATVAHGGTEIGSSRKFGLGIQLGGPSGLTGKFYTAGRNNAIDFTVGSGYYGSDPFGGPYGFAAQVAYHWHLETIASGGGVTIPFRVGVGGWFVTDGYGWAGDGYVGARVPFGLDFDLESAPFQFYIEAAFRLGIVPGFGAGVDAAIGARYYF